MDCFQVRLRIQLMFDGLDVEIVDKTRAEINPHLLKCAKCREFLKMKTEENEKRR